MKRSVLVWMLSALVIAIYINANHIAVFAAEIIEENSSDEIITDQIIADSEGSEDVWQVGDTAYAVYDESTNTLRIEGSGLMWDTSGGKRYITAENGGAGNCPSKYLDNPYYDLLVRSSVPIHVVIGNDITGIGACTIGGIKNGTKYIDTVADVFIENPQNIEYIGYKALSEIKILNNELDLSGLKSIRGYGLLGSYGFESLTIGESCEYIESGAFAFMHDCKIINYNAISAERGHVQNNPGYNSDFRTYTSERGNVAKEEGESADKYSSWPSAKIYVFKEHVATDVYFAAVGDDQDGVTINISNCVKKIPDFLFYDSMVDTINISSDSSIEYIGGYCFADTDIEEIVVPKKVALIGEGIVDCTPNLKKIYYYAQNAENHYEYIYQNGSSTHTPATDGISKYWRRGKGAEIYLHFERVSNNRCQSIFGTSGAVDESARKNHDETGTLYTLCIMSGVETLPYCMCANDSGLETIDFSNAVDLFMIPDGFAYDHHSTQPHLKNVIGLEKTRVTNIGECAFYNDRLVETPIKLPPTVKKISAYAFNGMDSVREFTIHDGIIYYDSDKSEGSYEPAGSDKDPVRQPIVDQNSFAQYYFIPQRIATTGTYPGMRTGTLQPITPAVDTVLAVDYDTQNENDVDEWAKAGRNIGNTKEYHINYSGYAIKKIELIDDKGNRILSGTNVKYARSDERRGYRTETIDNNGAIYVKSNKYTYDPKGNNNHSFDTVITDMNGKELAKVSMDNIIVDNISFNESWEGKLGAKGSAGVGLEAGICDVEAGVADVKATLSRSAVVNVKNEYDKGSRTLEISQSYDARIGAKGSLGPKASTINNCIEISGISVNAEAGIGHQAVAGVKIPDYDPHNTDQNNKAGRSVLLGIAESQGNVMLLEIVEVLGYENTINTYKSKTTFDGSAGMDVLKFQNKFGNNKNIEADISEASGKIKGIVSYEAAWDSSDIDKPTTYTKTRKYTNSGEINFLDTSVSVLKKTDDIDYSVKSGVQLGFDPQYVADFSVTADLKEKHDTSLNGQDDDVINKIQYSTILYQPETVFDYTLYEKDNGEIKRETTYWDDAVSKIINDPEKTTNSRNIKYFYKDYLSSLSRDDYKYVDQYEANATYELKNTDRTKVGLTIPLKVQLGLGVGIDEEISCTYESSYCLEKGDYVYNEEDTNKEYIPSSKTDSVIIEENIEKVGFGAMGFDEVLDKPIKAIVPDIKAHIKDLSADQIGENIVSKMFSTVYSFDENNPVRKLYLHLVSVFDPDAFNNLGNGTEDYDEAQSYEIYTFPETDTVDALYSSEEGKVASTVGDPYIIYTTDENGNEVNDWGGQTLRIELGYTNEMLEAAGAGLDDVSKLAVYEYSAEKLGYIYKGGEVDTINKKVFLDISEPGQYILAIDNAAPVVSVFTTDGKNPPTIICTIDDMTDLSEYSMTLDGNEIVNTENIKNYFDLETQSVYYPVTEKLSIGDHIATVYASDAQGNSMESPIELIINIKEEDDNSKYGDVLSVDIPLDGIIPDGIWIAGVTDMSYTGKALTQNFRVYDGTTMLTPKTDYTVKYKNNKKAYSIANLNNLTANDKKKAPQILITMKGNYSGKETVYFSINPTGENPAKADTKPYALTGDKIKITDENGNSTLSAEYNKAGAKPSIRVMYEDKLLKEGRDYTLKYSGNATYPATKASVTVTGKGNYTSKKIIPITVTQRPFSKETGITVVAADKAEGKKAGQYATTVKVFDSEGKLLKAGTDYEKNIVYLKSGTELTKTDYPKAGDVITVRITGKGGYTNSFIEANYNILASGQVNDIGKATFKIKNQAYNKGKVITITSQEMFDQAFIGKSKMPLKLSTDGGETGDFMVVPGSYVKNTTKGTAKVTFMGINGKTGTKTVSFKIGTRSIIDIWFGRL